MPATQINPNKRSTPTLEAQHLWTSSQPTQSTNLDNTTSNTPEAVHQFILNRNLIPEQQPIIIHNLATTLLHITEAQKIPKTLEEAIHAVSILLTDLSDRTMISDTASSICKYLTGANGSFHPIINNLKDLANNIKASSTSLLSATNKLQTESNITAQKIITAFSLHPPNPPSAPQSTMGNSAPFPTYAAALVACPSNPLTYT